MRSQSCACQRVGQENIPNGVLPSLMGYAGFFNREWPTQGLPGVLSLNVPSDLQEPKVLAILSLIASGLSNQFGICHSVHNQCLLGRLSGISLLCGSSPNHSFWLPEASITERKEQL